MESSLLGSRTIIVESNDSDCQADQQDYESHCNS
jgi:hypothetical protein